MDKFSHAIGESLQRFLPPKFFLRRATPPPKRLRRKKKLLPLKREKAKTRFYFLTAFFSSSKKKMLKSFPSRLEGRLMMPSTIRRRFRCSSPLRFLLPRR